MDPVSSVLGFRQGDALSTFGKMWYHIFLWTFFSSMFVHFVAAIVAFVTLRKHKFGKFFPVLIMVMGIITPIVCGNVSSAIIAFVYRASSLPMAPLYAAFWGIGQTFLSACIGFTRILATL